MVEVTFYRMEGCWLCDNAEDLLNGLKEEHGLAIKTVDITSDDTLYELYRFDIPVVEFEDGEALHGRIRKKDLLRLIDGHKERGRS